MSDGLDLYEVLPREQVGAQTGALYEYQYHQAAAEALTLLTDEASVCVYCEWHDDFVSENSSSACYAFHQVKTRIKSKGPWRLVEFFGITKPSKEQKEPALDQSSIFAHLWDHTTKFGHKCGRFVFVTNAGIESDLADFLCEVSTCSSASQLSAASQAKFQRIFSQASCTLKGVTSDSLFTFLSNLRMGDAVGTVQDLEAVKLLLANRVYESSEVDLLISEARKIGADLVAEVRSRSHRVLDKLPGSTEELRKLKGLIVDDILKVLSLSVDGYRQLRKEGKDAVRTLSRLHRLCRQSRVPEEHVPLLCTCKLTWTSWWIQERDKIETIDILALRHECIDLLKLHVSGSLGFSDLLKQTTELAQKYRPKLASFTPLTGQLVFGLLLEIAVEAEDLR
jgi:hypothetical protein